MLLKVHKVQKILDYKLSLCFFGGVFKGYLEDLLSMRKKIHIFFPFDRRLETNSDNCISGGIFKIFFQL